MEQSDSYFNHLIKKLKGKPLDGKASLSPLKLLENQGRFPCTHIFGADSAHHRITSTKVQKPGLGLAGHLDYIQEGRIQLLGRSEMTFFERNTEKASKYLLEIDKKTRSAFIVSRSIPIPDALLKLAEEHGFPLFSSPLTGQDISRKVSSILERILAPRVHIHGNLMSVFELGVLILGKSGVGKSECALDLLMRGQRLIGDDMVYIHKNNEGNLIGYGDELTRYHMEIRGLGIINIRELFSIAAVADSHEVSMVVYLEKWDFKRCYDSLGLEESTVEILGLKRPLYRLPVAPGRNLANLIEVAVRNHYLKGIGHHPAKEIIRKLDEKLNQPPPLS